MNIGFAICLYFQNNISIIRYRKTNIELEVKAVHDHEEDCCCGGVHHPRMFLTKEEKITHLNKYKEWLQNEAKGVDEAIAKLKEA
jgi:hypothetical protein